MYIGSEIDYRKRQTKVTGRTQKKEDDKLLKRKNCFSEDSLLLNKRLAL